MKVEYDRLVVVVVGRGGGGGDGLFGRFKDQTNDRSRDVILARILASPCKLTCTIHIFILAAASCVRPRHICNEEKYSRVKKYLAYLCPEFGWTYVRICSILLNAAHLYVRTYSVGAGRKEDRIMHTSTIYTTALCFPS